MKTKHSLFLLAAVCSMPAIAATTTINSPQMHYTVHVLQPSCTIDAGPAIDFGKVSVTDLNTAAATKKVQSLTISCNALTTPVGLTMQPSAAEGDSNPASGDYTSSKSHLSYHIVSSGAQFGLTDGQQLPAGDNIFAMSGVTAPSIGASTPVKLKLGVNLATDDSSAVTSGAFNDLINISLTY
ncbi:fimbrial major subunit CsuA/B family protein [Pandoraea fibrosis]|uniref:Fimbrial major subunit CsuA/B family protein n=1 Tax=Pandoraea fibrosis TaxID=1891094 RepID=A0ABX6HRU1_9BURK|nr:spore coat protein U domain-containing protein [Pandoraea fibrosis]QHE92900.1 fimbrial major subunit CsuA/B family protein [Pandoraea fibrosis]QHF13543.1 fimbrial major subunit CsuA/B family protein [Pandoraea fibrosis]